jgi:DNA-binding MarR family transcriptional regulator
MPPLVSETSRVPRVPAPLSAVEAVKRKGEDTDWTLYHALSKAIGWSTGKVYASVKRLTEDGLVRIEKSMKDGRSVLLVRPLEWQEFFTPEDLEEFKNLDV